MNALLLHRRPDWRPRLRTWLIEVDGLPLVYGQHDCCLFGAGAVLAQTGVDLATFWRGRYTTLRGGLRILRRAGYRDFVDLVAAHLAEAQGRFVREGDLAVIETGTGPAIGVSQGSAIYILTESGRLGLTPFSAVQRQFRVER